MNLKTAVAMMGSLLMAGSLLAAPDETPVQIPATPLEARVQVDISGEWDSALAKEASETPPADLKWEKTTVPMLKKRPKGISCMYYRRDLDIPADWKGRRVQLVMLGNATWTTVYLNGKKVADAFTANCPMVADLTDAVNWSGKNSLLLAVQSDEKFRMTTDSQGKTVSNYPCSYWIPNIGIGGPTYLQAVSPVHIDHVFVKTSYRKKRIDADVWIVNKGITDAKASVSGSIAQGVELPPVEVRVPAGATIKATIGQDWLSPRLWQIGEPNLYHLQTKLSIDGKLCDDRNDRFGFREFWIEGTDYYFNGAKFFLKMQTFGVYPPSFENRTMEQAKDAVRKEVAITFEANQNCIRWWFQVPSYLYDVCAEAGLVSNSFIFSDQGEGACVSKDNIYWKNCEKVFDKLFAFACNHPSVFYWTLQNEGWIYPKPGEFGVMLLQQQQDTAKHIQTTDPTRFVNSDGDGDIAGWADYIRLSQDPNSPPRNPGVAPQTSWHMGSGGPNNPRDYYWIEENMVPRWDKTTPLVLGEFDFNVATVFDVIPYYGDDAFSKDRSQHDPWDWYSNVIRSARVQGV